MKRRFFLPSLVGHLLFAAVAVALPLNPNINNFSAPSFCPKKAAAALNLIAWKMREKSPPELWNAPENELRILLALYFCDRESYCRHGQSISTFTYLKMPEGPMPDPHQLKQAMEVLISDDETQKLEPTTKPTKP